MTTRAEFLTERYGAYYHREVVPEDEELTHVGPGTPCGEWMRRYWIPVAYSADLKDLPRRIRILGEDLVIFRDNRGAVGLLELHCSHRGTSLEFGLVADKGIRCCYHGWLFDVDGKILETPGEPADSTLKDRLCHGAYPVHEQAGVVFAYMGPADKQPPFPIYDTYDAPGMTTVPMVSHVFPCNWLQVKENCMDPAHLFFLHTTVSQVQFSEDLAEKPEMDFMETPLGMIYIDTRRLGDRVWVRIADYIAPYAHQFLLNPREGRRNVEHAERTHWAVPLDDTHTMFMGLQRLHPGQEPERGAGFGQTNDRLYEERQRVPGDYDAQVGQRPIARHGMEHLATTDRGVIMLRNLVRQGIRAVQDGKQPLMSKQKEGQIVPTYASGTVLTIPPASRLADDRQLLRDTGRRVAQELVEKRTGG